jgi:hypothetical protein
LAILPSDVSAGKSNSELANIAPAYLALRCAGAVLVSEKIQKSQLIYTL